MCSVRSETSLRKTPLIEGSGHVQDAWNTDVDDRSSQHQEGAKNHADSGSEDAVDRVLRSSTLKVGVAGGGGLGGRNNGDPGSRGEGNDTAIGTSRGESLGNSAGSRLGTLGDGGLGSLLGSSLLAWKMLANTASGGFRRRLVECMSCHGIIQGLAALANLMNISGHIKNM